MAYMYSTASPKLCRQCDDSRPTIYGGNEVYCTRNRHVCVQACNSPVPKQMAGLSS